ncbi:MAG: hypothetical protein SFY81_01740 [Verrucomicrobiota bacterium]|nr:hypothetical protein [Verrucomicrobiota bacterium]
MSAAAVIQEIKTGLYYQAPGSWTGDRATALLFRDAAEADLCVRRNHLMDVYIVAGR